MAKKEKKPSHEKPEQKKAQGEAESAVEESACEEAASEVQEQEKQSDVETKLCEQLKAKDEQFLRLAAEYDNYRKRTAKEKEETYQNATAQVLTEFLEVADNFERAMKAESELEDYKKGIEMIFTQFSDKMQKLGAQPFGEAGESFDPELHMAVSHVEDETKGEGEITEVYQKGYKLGDKVIRHAMVIVAN
ncbi:MAG: nucleotide exchange factor GrpE [Clostridia bacterium]|nr:nucleotide exchange factor GrpE [Clostridia bacterium]